MGWMWHDVFYEYLEFILRLLCFIMLRYEGYCAVWEDFWMLGKQEPGHSMRILEWNPLVCELASLNLTDRS